MPFAINTKIRTILGWSHGLRLAVGSRVLSCGCACGSYETWEGGVVEIVDHHHPACGVPTHGENTIIACTPAASPSHQEQRATH